MKITRSLFGIVAVTLIGCGTATPQLAHAGPPAWTGATPTTVAVPTVPKGLTSTARPLPEDIAAMVRARSPHISPDGTQIAYTVGTATRDPEAKPSDSDTTGGWSRASHLFVIGTKTGSTPRQLTFG
ncbi:MAG: hypothetical protein ACI9MR_004428, partial [Myxococcota bacterium]